MSWDCVVQNSENTFFLIEDFARKVSKLPAVQVDKLVDVLYPIAVSAFQVSPSSKFYDDVRNHITEAGSLLVCCSGSSVAGFVSVMDIVECDTLFFHGIAIDSRFHHSGIASMAFDVLFDHSKRKRVAFTTQNPRMYCLLRKKVKKCFPSPEFPNVAETEWKYGQGLINGRSGSFIPEFFILQDLYTSCLYSEIPLTKDEKVNSWFQQSLTVESGQTRSGLLLCGER